MRHQILTPFLRVFKNIARYLFTIFETSGAYVLCTNLIQVLHINVYKVLYILRSILNVDLQSSGSSRLVPSNSGASRARSAAPGALAAPLFKSIYTLGTVFHLFLMWTFYNNLV